MPDAAWPQCNICMNIPSKAPLWSTHSEGTGSRTQFLSYGEGSR